MLFDKTILVGLGIVIGIYLLYKVLTSRNSDGNEYETLYNKVLTSDEYKVKGQHEK